MADPTDTNETIITPAQAEAAESVDKIPCGICRRQFSRYPSPLHLPRNPTMLTRPIPSRLAPSRPHPIPLCPQSHSRCSEPFYRAELETDIRAEPSKSAEERARMMELLRRFEADALDDPFADSPDEPDSDPAEAADGDDLERRLAGMDLDGASYEQLWAVLTPSERTKFLTAVRDPSSELAQQLLARQALAEEPLEPWWLAGAPPGPTHPPNPPSLQLAHRPPPKYAPRPALVPLPASLARPPPRAEQRDFPLAYNLVAILIAYAYATRHLAASPLSSLEAPADARALMGRAVPFLVDRRATTRFASLAGVVTDVWSRLGQVRPFFRPERIGGAFVGVFFLFSDWVGGREQGTMTPSAFSLLLRDAATLLAPRRVSVVGFINDDDDDDDDGDGGAPAREDPPADPPASPASRALSDLHALFRPAHPSVAAKVLFYAAQVQGAPPPVLAALAAEVGAKARRVEAESLVGAGVAAGAGATLGRPGSGDGGRPKKAVVTLVDS
ncbi:hypothetical protein HETIRDRAFT_104350 [Heterobasidion irregulare TC 32-1]|uniref:Uncharacterized protein n=1 Tax=Heterobasidion irregulare (strain TC 32-1) TaxID=747525 RepID=W4K118_HETIT|nr:uncharacterized protein HETIRDRAFT_104350 [Heterobasidion irregulare TC 32-1]ETW79035.1 hypothetical protein HETIRDRAFT_104350 [Heterobasidion irregulare TC 32-1]